MAISLPSSRLASIGLYSDPAGCRMRSAECSAAWSKARARDFRHRPKTARRRRAYGDPDDCELSTRMIEAVLDGEGPQGVAELAAAEAGSPGGDRPAASRDSRSSPGRRGDQRPRRVREGAGRLRPTAIPPDPVALERSIEAGGAQVGGGPAARRMRCRGRRRAAGPGRPRGGAARRQRPPALRRVVAVGDAREDAERKMRGGLI